MTRKEIVDRLNKGEIVTVVFYTRSVSRYIGKDRLTDKQFDFIRPMIDCYRNDYGGITTHYYRLKQKK